MDPANNEGPAAVTADDDGSKKDAASNGMGRNINNSGNSSNGNGNRRASFRETLVTETYVVPRVDDDMKPQLFYNKLDYRQFQQDEQHRYDKKMMKQIQGLVRQAMAPQLDAAIERGASPEEIEAMMPQTTEEIFRLLGGLPAGQASSFMPAPPPKMMATKEEILHKHHAEEEEEQAFVAFEPGQEPDSKDDTQLPSSTSFHSEEHGTQDFSDDDILNMFSVSDKKDIAVEEKQGGGGDESSSEPAIVSPGDSHLEPYTDDDIYAMLEVDQTAATKVEAPLSATKPNVDEQQHPASVTDQDTDDQESRSSSSVSVPSASDSVPEVLSPQPTDEKSPKPKKKKPVTVATDTPSNKLEATTQDAAVDDDEDASAEHINEVLGTSFSSEVDAHDLVPSFVEQQDGGDGTTSVLDDQEPELTDDEIMQAMKHDLKQADEKTQQDGGAEKATADDEEPELTDDEIMQAMKNELNKDNEKTKDGAGEIVALDDEERELTDDEIMQAMKNELKQADEKKQQDGGAEKVASDDEEPEPTDAEIMQAMKKELKHADEKKQQASGADKVALDDEEPELTDDEIMRAMKKELKQADEKKQQAGGSEKVALDDGEPELTDDEIMQAMKKELNKADARKEDPTTSSATIQAKKQTDEGQHQPVENIFNGSSDDKEKSKPRAKVKDNGPVESAEETPLGKRQVKDQNAADTADPLSDSKEDASSAAAGTGQRSDNNSLENKESETIAKADELGTTQVVPESQEKNKSTADKLWGKVVKKEGKKKTAPGRERKSPITGERRKTRVPRTSVIQVDPDPETWKQVDPLPVPKNVAPLTPGGSKKSVVVKNGVGAPKAKKDSHTTRRSSSKKTAQRSSYDVKGGWGNPFESGGSDHRPKSRPSRKSSAASTSK